MSKEKLSLGESLVEEGLLTPEQLKTALEEDRRTGQRLRKILVRLGFIAEEDLVAFLSHKLGVPRVELENTIIDPKVVELVPEELARKYEAIPVLKIGNRLTCALVDPWNIFALDELRARTGLLIEPAVATQEEIKRALDEYYGVQGSMENVLDTIKKNEPTVSSEPIDTRRLDEIVKEPVVIKLVNLLVLEAVKQGASDIHVEPEEKSLKTRFRVDGILHEVPSPPKHLQAAIISRIKILANLDIAERRMPQDGRFNLQIEGRHIDVRVSCLPTIFGENVVMRLLDLSSALLPLERLGLPQSIQQSYEKLIRRAHGIVLVTGPTGSGKTTTLYSSLDKINTPEKNIITIEDPIEYRLPGVRQIQVNPKVNLTFASGLRSILRQDPDVIMVGEIRDFEAAEIAIQAALTGHLVFSTLHTNDAAGSVTRLLDMGVEPFLIASSLAGLVAQRLVRLICPDCKASYELEAGSQVLKDLGVRADGAFKAWRGKGCSRCLQTGYRGRIAICELLMPDEKIHSLILSRASSHAIKNQAVANGMVTMKEDGVNKASQGLTTIEEVLRVTQED